MRKPRKIKNPHIGSSLDNFLKEEGIYEEAEAAAIKHASSHRITNEIMTILERAKKLAQRYRTLTGKPLGIAGEVAEYEAARHLGLELVPARQAGYDAIRRGKRKIELLQVKGRCVLPSSRSQRIGKIDITKQFDAVLLVLMDEFLNATAIYEAPRTPVIKALKKPGSKARNKRGQLGVQKFRSMARRIWPMTD
jgi:hypothetical protein